MVQRTPPLPPPPLPAAALAPLPMPAAFHMSRVLAVAVHAKLKDTIRVAPQQEATGLLAGGGRGLLWARGAVSCLLEHHGRAKCSHPHTGE